jgi:hypothetical protein
MNRKTREAIALDFEATLKGLRAYRKSDPDFERAIADYIDTEASLQEDPAEGKNWTSGAIAKAVGSPRNSCGDSTASKTAFVPSGTAAELEKRPYSQKNRRTA